MGAGDSEEDKRNDRGIEDRGILKAEAEADILDSYRGH